MGEHSIPGRRVQRLRTAAADTTQAPQMPPTPEVPIAPMLSSNPAAVPWPRRVAAGSTAPAPGALEVDALLAPFFSLLPPAHSPRRESLLAALNGLVGDHLARGAHPLALALQLRRAGRPVDPARAPLPHADHVVVLVHGLCMSDRVWCREGRDLPAALERELGATALTVLYNTGLSVAANGRALAEQLQAQLAPARPRRLSLVGHGLGGLVVRSACRQAQAAGHGWLQALGGLFFLGTPHHGLPLEHAGHWLHRVMDLCPYVGPFSQLSRLRSAGILDLQAGRVLDDEAGPPLPHGVPAHVVATMAGSAGLPGSMSSDGLVPLDSALGRHVDPRRALDVAPQRQWVGQGIHHLEQPTHREVHRRLLGWLAD